MASTVTEETVEQYHRDGVVLLRGLFEPWIEGLRSAIEENKAAPSWRERTYRPGDGRSPFFQDYCVWNRFDGYRALVVASPMAEVAARLMRSGTARVFHDHVLVKEPGNSTETPWHHDLPYYLVDGPCTVSFWVPADPVPRERGIEYVAGSHRWGRSFRPTRFDGTPLYADDPSDPVPDLDADRDALEIRSWDVEPGDAIAFDFSTLHRADANHSELRRRVTSVRWVGDGARFVERADTTSPAFPDLVYRDGDPFEGDEFPQLWPPSG